MPEEINRIVTDSLVDLLLTPSMDANENLIHEGIPKERIRFVGNTMIDTLVKNLNMAEKAKTFRKWNFHLGEYIFVTLYRPSNVVTEIIFRPENKSFSMRRTCCHLTNQV